MCVGCVWRDWENAPTATAASCAGEGVSAVRCGERGGRRAGGITYSCVAAIAEDFEAGLGGEGLAAGNDAVGAVDDRAAGGEAGESGAERERHSAGNWGAGGSRGCGQRALVWLRAPSACGGLGMRDPPTHE